MGKKTLGIALTRMENNGISIKSTAESLPLAVMRTIAEKNKSSEQFTFIDTIGDGSQFDYSQEYLKMNKRDILELQYNYQQKSVNLLMNILGLTTLGILPLKKTFQFSVVPIIYDSNGNAYPLKPIDSPTIDEWRSWLLFPFGSSKSKEIDYIQYVLSETINSALEEIETRNIAISTFRGNYKKLNLPMRLAHTDTSICDVLVDSANRSYMTAGVGNKICRVELLFQNNTDRILSISSQNFRLVVDGKEVPAMESISAENNQFKTLSSFVSLKPNSSGWYPEMIVYFSIPRSSKPTLLRYVDKELSENPIEMKFTVKN
ncbi:hypothetical protein LPTSP4_24920 [Leptospira ryugenii]|uniref:Uncharacterized protein n=2 Tax=Leptospira ryugenii TaxID=1917863 RepID=A0A2P2E248_9LEPT|nr:hypothetical protein LPTSP4_24920 [Leptospira ryugenii]